MSRGRRYPAERFKVVGPRARHCSYSTSRLLVCRPLTRPALQLFDLTTTSMPSTNPGGLVARDYAAILPFMLYENGYAASATDLELKSQVAPKLALGYPSAGQQPPSPQISALSHRMT